MYFCIVKVDESDSLLHHKKLNIDGPGEMGKAVFLPQNLTAEQKILRDDGWKRNQFNQYVSDMISIHRTLPEPRNEK